MDRNILVTVIIATRDRADDLRRTLGSLGGVRIPERVVAELLVVDNGPDEATARVAAEFRRVDMPLRLLREPAPGKSRALNAALAAARGEVLLFADDDVRFPADWIEGTIAPILAGQADAVQGAVRLSPHLQRAWMQPIHRLLMAETLGLDEREFEMIGANMAVSRRVFSKVPTFDVELGPGASGLGEDSLFSRQVRAAGFRLKLLKNPVVEHHFDPCRLGRGAFLKRTAAMGRSLAYIAWHWEHRAIRWPQLRLLKAIARLAWFRHRGGVRADANAEGCDPEEMCRVSGVHFYQQYLRECRQPHHYEKHGLRRLTT
jgi:glycosyltransferase involved in cell wall biosynthesis